VVTLPRQVYEEMLAHCQAGYPGEACGVLASDADGEIIKHWTTRNAADDPEDFSIIDSPELYAIWKETEANDWTLFAYYHSHTQTEAYPSPRDIAYAQWWPGTYYLIFTLRERTAPQLRAFLVHGDNVEEHEIQIV
jgi:[CysO sulfur-carrier protein]-S-L-cysteine hydrolase